MTTNKMANPAAKFLFLHYFIIREILIRKQRAFEGLLTRILVETRLATLDLFVSLALRIDSLLGSTMSDFSHFFVIYTLQQMPLNNKVFHRIF